MSEEIEQLESLLEEVLTPVFRGRLLDRGRARALVWADGVMPEGGQQFAESLSDDLLDYGFSVLSMGLELRSLRPDSPLLTRVFLAAGDSIEAAVHRGSVNHKSGFHRVSAAVAFHLARFSARAFSVLSVAESELNFSPAELAIVYILRRDFSSLHGLFADRLLDESNTDAGIAAKLKEVVGFEAEDAIHEVLLTAFMQGIALFDHALKVGSKESANEAKQRLVEVAETASSVKAVNHWWTAQLTAHLIDELWELSLYARIPTLPDDDPYSEAWGDLRLNYIQRLYASERASVELWPSQLEAANRALNHEDDLVVALPTSAGKTRIAELCILRTLSTALRIVYVTPLRALSAQIENDLADIFRPLGYRVSSLYGSAGVVSGDAETLKTGDIVVSTPEKLDFALRNDSTIIDDVGLVVFDEGHMLGMGEREVRYETLVQRILSRDDSASRRVVCLSALFPSPEEMKDLVGWIRQDEPGSPVHSDWRPTRQRFGIVEWLSSNTARLEIIFGEENPFVPSFIVARDPPPTTKRRKPFPSDKNELILASAWKFVSQGKRVMIYCSLRKSVIGIGRLILDLVERDILEPLSQPSSRLRQAQSVGVEWLGAEHPAVKCLNFGVAIHHGGLPRQFLSELEALLKEGQCKLVVASPTLAQGLNLSASVLIMHSIWRNAAIIPSKEFANVAGRSGRAFVDLEGLVLHAVWGSQYKKAQAVRNWKKLVEEAKAPAINSGILELSVFIFMKIAEMNQIDLSTVADYVLGNSSAWDFVKDEDSDYRECDWDGSLASLDSALLGMLDAELEEDELFDTLKKSLDSSLFQRQVEAKYDANVVDALMALMGCRAKEIWNNTNSSQRSGFYSAGIGLSAGLAISENIKTLCSLLREIEAGIENGQVDGVPEALIKFAEIVLEIPPFKAPKELPDGWRDALKGWIRGESADVVINVCGELGVDFLQEAVGYRIPWAMEAVRVHCDAIGQPYADTISGLAALSVESGSMNESVITLIRNGLQSRKAAQVAVHSTSASFNNRKGMLSWLNSGEVVVNSQSDTWPSLETRYSWMKFLSRRNHPVYRKWRRQAFTLAVEWSEDAPTSGTAVILGSEEAGGGHHVLSPDYCNLGITEYAVDVTRLVKAYVDDDTSRIVLEYYGPIAK